MLEWIRGDHESRTGYRCALRPWRRLWGWLRHDTTKDYRYKVGFWIDLRRMRINWWALAPHELLILGNYFRTRDQAKAACERHAKSKEVMPSGP